MRIEEAHGHGVAGCLEHFHHPQNGPGRGEQPSDLSVLVSRLLVDEDVLQGDLVALDPGDLRDVGDLSAAVPQAVLLDDDVDRGCDLFTDSAGGQLHAGHQHQCLEPGDRVTWRVRVDRGQGAIMASVHGLEHVQRFAGTDLSDDDPVWAHSEGVDDEVSDADPTFAFDVGRPRLEVDDVNLAQLQLGGILDGDDALVAGNKAREDV